MIYTLIALSVIGNSTAQLLLRKGMMTIGGFPKDMNLDKLWQFFVDAFTSPWVWSAIGVTFLTALTWFMALSRWQLSFLYPFMALCYVLVALLSWLLFKESITLVRWTGIVVICVGVCLVAKS